MTSRQNIRVVCAGLVMWAAMLSAACGKNDRIVTTAQDRIYADLKTQGVYERGNLPDGVVYDQIKGWFDIVGGAYRHIVNENRTNRASGREFDITRDDSIAFMFDARIFTGGAFDGLQTFYTNIASRIQVIAGNNPDLSHEFWPVDPLRIKVGDDSRILKSLQEALIGCKAGDGNPDNNDQPDDIASDVVRIYLTPDIAFGNRTVYNVPANSTIVFEITEIEIIK